MGLFNFNHQHPGQLRDDDDDLPRRRRRHRSRAARDEIEGAGELLEAIETFKYHAGKSGDAAQAISGLLNRHPRLQAEYDAWIKADKPISLAEWMREAATRKSFPAIVRKRHMALVWSRQSLPRYRIRRIDPDEAA